jgi:hypothetical protein
MNIQSPQGFLWLASIHKRYCPVSLQLKHNVFVFSSVPCQTCYSEFLHFCIYCCCTWHNWQGLHFTELLATFLPWCILCNSNANVPSLFNRMCASNAMISLYKIQNTTGRVSCWSVCMQQGWCNTPLTDLALLSLIYPVFKPDWWYVMYKIYLHIRWRHFTSFNVREIPIWSMFNFVYDYWVTPHLSGIKVRKILILYFGGYNMC